MNRGLELSPFQVTIFGVEFNSALRRLSVGFESTNSDIAKMVRSPEYDDLIHVGYARWVSLRNCKESHGKCRNKARYVGIQIRRM